MRYRLASYAAPFAGVIAAVAIWAPGAQAATPTCHGHAATIVGTAAGDTLVGTPGPDVIVGLGGNDQIAGRGGNDIVCGGAGADVLRGGRGSDHLQGGRGSDSPNQCSAVHHDLLLSPGDFARRRRWPGPGRPVAAGCRRGQLYGFADLRHAKQDYPSVENRPTAALLGEGRNHPWDGRMVPSTAVR